MKAQQLAPGEPLFLRPGPAPKSIRQLSEEQAREAQHRRELEAKTKTELDAKVQADPEYFTRPNKFTIAQDGTYGR